MLRPLGARCATRVGSFARQVVHGSDVARNICLGARAIALTVLFGIVKLLTTPPGKLSEEGGDEKRGSDLAPQRNIHERKQDN